LPLIFDCALYYSISLSLQSRVNSIPEGRPMNGLAKLCGVAAVAVIAAIASFQGSIAFALGVSVVMIAGFIAIAILVGAAMSTRHSRPVAESGRAPVLDAAPAISPLQEQ